MTISACGRQRGRTAVWLAVLAVLTLFMSPVLAGRAHAAMLSPVPMPMAMAGMVHIGKTVAAAPCHHDGEAACSVACALASQLLPPAASDAAPPIGAAGEADYANLERSVSEAVPERSTPPPR